MANSITLKSKKRESWLYQLTDVVTELKELLTILSLEHLEKEILSKNNLIYSFSLKVPRSFIKRMKIGDAKDPLLLQVLYNQMEFINTSDYRTDPLDEHDTPIPGLLHKHQNRVLLIIKNSCAIHCRYCFRRHFPYKHHPGNKKTWEGALNYITLHNELDEVIFSGGDPLMAKDHELDWIISKLEKITHLKRLRIHTRLPVVIPSRITQKLCQRIYQSRLKILFVTHINHVQEINSALRHSMHMLKCSGVTLLNQSVLLRNVNNDPTTLAKLSNGLFDAGILPYYIHLLDKVSGVSHFLVRDDEACIILRKLMTMVSGYMVPRLIRTIPKKPYKIHINLE
ncbi:EF-P beta-lysylation protein EpmB [Candidatus Ishikawella capsulata]|nr:EF-P beta-lysylation protein EpmB [Candidatus Ishikawaella capsulata]